MTLLEVLLANGLRNPIDSYGMTEACPDHLFCIVANCEKYKGCLDCWNRPWKGESLIEPEKV